MVDYLERVSVCLLHTSVNNRHPILEKVIKDRDCHTVEITRGVDDIVRHGTKKGEFCTLKDKLESMDGYSRILLPEVCRNAGQAEC